MSTFEFKGWHDHANKGSCSVCKDHVTPSGLKPHRVAVFTVGPAEIRACAGCVQKLQREAFTALDVARQMVEGRAIYYQLGPHAACRECGMGGDVGGTEPNPIPF